MSNLPITGVFNDGLIAEQYEAFKRDPALVDESWRQFFRIAEQLSGAGQAPGAYDASLLRKAAAASSLLGAIQRYGHLAVQLDPLGSAPPGAAELKPEFHGISESDLQQLPASSLDADAKALGKASVTAEVIAETKGPKIKIIKFKNKTGYKKRQGHRQRYTQVKVTGIKG